MAIKKGRFHDQRTWKRPFSIGGRMLERRWKLPASTRYSFLRETKRLDLRRNQAFSKYLVEISGIEPLTS